MPQECFSLHIDRVQQKSHVGDSTKKLPKDLTIPICLWLGHFREFETRSNEAWRHHVFVQADSMCPLHLVAIVCADTHQLGILKATNATYQEPSSGTAVLSPEEQEEFEGVLCRKVQALSPYCCPSTTDGGFFFPSKPQHNLTTSYAGCMQPNKYSDIVSEVSLINYTHH